MIAVAEDGRVLAHYGALAQRALVDGRWTVFLQAVDSFCDPRARGGLARGGLFARVGRAFERAFVGLPITAAPAANTASAANVAPAANLASVANPAPGPAVPDTDGTCPGGTGGADSQQSECGARGLERAPFIWGLPVLPAWRSGRGQLGYGQLRQLLLLVGEVEQLEACEGSAGDSATTVRELGPDELPPNACDILARRLLMTRRVGVLRDRAWLAWRYRQRPAVEYHLALAERGGELLGLAVARIIDTRAESQPWLLPAPFPGQLEAANPAGKCLVLCEWCVPAGEDARPVGRALLAWARERAQAAGARSIHIHLGERSAEFQALQAAGFKVRATGRTVAARSFLPRRDLVWFADHLEVSLGDTDLI
jgi:hypothetical protein